MEILKIFVNIIETNEVISENTTVRMILFDGYCEGAFFNGTILNGGVDTQFITIGQNTTLSARYMLKGYDNQNEPCHLFIENNAESKNDISDTRPRIFTDSKNLKWLEKAELTGKIENEDGKLVIKISSSYHESPQVSPMPHSM